jgi:translation initiation factor 4G
MRQDGWKPRRAAAGPKLLSEIHDDVSIRLRVYGVPECVLTPTFQAAKAQQEESRRAQSSGGRLPKLHDQLPRGGSRRGQSRDQMGGAGPDGWTNVAPVPRAASKAGDLTHFGRVRDRPASSSGLPLGPSGE